MGAQNPSFRRAIGSKSYAEPSSFRNPRFEAMPGLRAEQLVASYSTLGFQASHLSRHAEVVERMQEDKATIFLSFTSNMVSSGLREIIAQLCAKKLVDCIVTSTGSIEEDMMKCSSPFALGSFEADDAEVKANGMNRIGNIFVKDEQYAHFEKFHLAFMEKMYEKHGKKMCMSEYVRELGLTLSDKNSFLYWCARNNIPVFLPGPLDGAMGDHFYYLQQAALERPVRNRRRRGSEALLRHHADGGKNRRHNPWRRDCQAPPDWRCNTEQRARLRSIPFNRDGGRRLAFRGAAARGGFAGTSSKTRPNSAFVEGDATLTFPASCMRDDAKIATGTTAQPASFI